jgi:hypothetical protein
MEVIGVAQKNVGAELFKIPVHDALNGAWVPTGMKAGV